MIIQLVISSILLMIVIGWYLTSKKFKLEKKQKTILVTLFLLIQVINAGFIWLFLPSKSLFNYLLSNIFLGIIGIGIISLLENLESVQISGKGRRSTASFKFSKLLVTFVLALFLLFGASFGYDIYSKKQVYKTLNLVEGTDTPELDKDDTPVTIPPKTVRNKMKKSMNQFDNQQFYNLGELQVQKVDGEVVYIAPLEFKGFLIG